jgi:hypothetical protein
MMQNDDDDCDFFEVLVLLVSCLEKEWIQSLSVWIHGEVCSLHRFPPDHRPNFSRVWQQG